MTMTMLSAAAAAARTTLRTAAASRRLGVRSAARCRVAPLCSSHPATASASAVPRLPRGSRLRPRVGVSAGFFVAAPFRCRRAAYFSTAPSKNRTVNILFGSQGGTAQLFAMQLGDELDELADEDPSSEVEVSVAALDDPPGSPQERLLAGPDKTNVLIASCTGVGDPPDNCREFYEWIMDADGGGGGGGPQNAGVEWDEVRYAVFGCGNSVAHPNNYNVIGKRLDERLRELGARRVHELGLGDDSDCIEDDFDTWQDSLVRRLTGSAAGDAAEEAEVEDREEEVEASVGDDSDRQPLAVPMEDSCWSGKDADEVAGGAAADAPKPATPAAAAERKDRPDAAKSKYPRLILRRFDDGRYDLPRDDLFDLQRTDAPFYKPGTKMLPVISNRALGTGGAEYVMRELRLDLGGESEFDAVSYEAGDHLLVYPRNAQCAVDSYLAALGAGVVNGSDLIEGVEPPPAEGGGGKAGRPYPHPVGVTVEETLMHCVDLSQPPSPAFARSILGRRDFSYKEEIAATRVTPIELIREAGRALSLEELLYNLPPMQPRYYSIASSPTVHPRTIFLAFRPVKYLTSLGHLREGLCTSFMKQLHPVSMSGGFDDLGVVHPRIPALVNSNPTFRLPPDDSTPIVLVAGGCGVAPIRSFLEERMQKYWGSRTGRGEGEEEATELGPAHVYLGFRSPRDEVYRSVVDAALRNGVITSADITYTKSCRRADKSCTLVTQVLEEEEHSRRVYDLVSKRGGHVYLCGGARQFGAAVENVLLRTFMRHGDMDHDEANDYLRTLITEGRLQEDLAD